MITNGLVLNYWQRPKNWRTATKDAVPILWPALAWKVIIPDCQHHSLNLFQRAVLRACRAGRFTPETLAQKLGLHEKLIEAVLAELIQQDFISPSSLIPTDNGERQLEGLENLWEGAYTAWFFQDALSGRVLPFFTGHPEQIEWEDSATSSAHVTVFADGPGLDAYLLESPQNPELPSKDTIAQALRAARQRDKNQQKKNGAQSTNQRPVTFIDLPSSKLIELSETAPEPVWLLTAGRLSTEDFQPTIDDLFSNGEDRSLWSELQKLAATEAPSESIRLAHASIIQLADHLRENKLGAIQDRVRQKAGDTIHQNLSPKIESHPEVFIHLVRMEVALSEAEHEVEDTLGRLNTARNKARSALEALLKAAEGRDQAQVEMRALLGNDDLTNREILKARAREMGFSEWPEQLTVRGSDLKKLGARWSPGRGFNLNLALVALLLRASCTDTHFLRDVAALEPRLFDLIIGIKAEGNQGSHDNESAESVPVEATFAFVRQMRSDLYRVVALLLELSPPSSS